MNFTSKLPPLPVTPLGRVPLVPPFTSLGVQDGDVLFEASVEALGAMGICNPDATAMTGGVLCLRNAEAVEGTPTNDDLILVFDVVNHTWAWRRGNTLRVTDVAAWFVVAWMLAVKPGGVQ